MIRWMEKLDHNDYYQYWHISGGKWLIYLSLVPFLLFYSSQALLVVAMFAPLFISIQSSTMIGGSAFEQPSMNYFQHVPIDVKKLKKALFSLFVSSLLFSYLILVLCLIISNQFYQLSTVWIGPNIILVITMGYLNSLMLGIRYATAKKDELSSDASYLLGIVVEIIYCVACLQLMTNRVTDITGLLILFVTSFCFLLISCFFKKTIRIPFNQKYAENTLVDLARIHTTKLPSLIAVIISAPIPLINFAFYPSILQQGQFSVPLIVTILIAMNAIKNLKSEKTYLEILPVTRSTIIKANIPNFFKAMINALLFTGMFLLVFNFVLSGLGLENQGLINSALLFPVIIIIMIMIIGVGAMIYRLYTIRKYHMFLLLLLIPFVYIAMTNTNMIYLAIAGLVGLILLIMSCHERAPQS